MDESPKINKELKMDPKVLLDFVNYHFKNYFATYTKTRSIFIDNYSSTTKVCYRMLSTSNEGYHILNALADDILIDIKNEKKYYSLEKMQEVLFNLVDLYSTLIRLKPQVKDKKIFTVIRSFFKKIDAYFETNCFEDKLKCIASEFKEIKTTVKLTGNENRPLRNVQVFVSARVQPEFEKYSSEVLLASGRSNKDGEIVLVLPRNKYIFRFSGDETVRETIREENLAPKIEFSLEENLPIGQPKVPVVTAPIKKEGFLKRLARRIFTENPKF
jgi:hypothetical protein